MLIFKLFGPSVTIRRVLHFRHFPPVVSSEIAGVCGLDEKKSPQFKETTPGTQSRKKSITIERKGGREVIVFGVVFHLEFT